MQSHTSAIYSCIFGAEIHRKSWRCRIYYFNPSASTIRLLEISFKRQVQFQSNLDKGFVVNQESLT